MCIVYTCASMCVCVSICSVRLLPWGKLECFGVKWLLCYHGCTVCYERSLWCCPTILSSKQTQRAGTKLFWHEISNTTMLTMLWCVCVYLCAYLCIDPNWFGSYWLGGPLLEALAIILIQCENKYVLLKSHKGNLFLVGNSTWQSSMNRSLFVWLLCFGIPAFFTTQMSKGSCIVLCGGVVDDCGDNSCFLRWWQNIPE